jgi:hypothetical protein
MNHNTLTESRSGKPPAREQNNKAAIRKKKKMENRIDALFKQAHVPNSPFQTNPVTGGQWFRGLDSIEEQKLEAARALAARDWFAQHGPADAPLLPLSSSERQKLKTGGLSHLVAWYAESLRANEYDCNAHATFDDYACGVMASSIAPDFITSDQTLLGRYPPRLLHRLGRGLIWIPLPDLCKGAVPRTGADAGFAEWAPAFAILNPDFAEWVYLSKANRHYRDIGAERLWVYERPQGWVIELTKGGSTDNRRVLTQFLGDLPIICPSSSLAIRLADACYPNNHHEYAVYWHPD